MSTDPLRVDSFDLRFPSPTRVTGTYVEQLAGRLSTRDFSVVDLVGAVRIASGDQIGRALFGDISVSARRRVRNRVLARLVNARVLTRPPRRVGGVRAGSDGALYALDSAGQRLAVRQSGGLRPRLRRPRIAGAKTLAHTLAVTELYVRLVEHGRVAAGEVVTFTTEPTCWWPDGNGGTLRPDAYSMLSTSTVADHWWIEVDRSTEHLPVIRRKLATYLDFVHRGQLGPDGLVPCVLVTAPDSLRSRDITAVIRRLPDPASRLYYSRRSCNRLRVIFVDRS